MSRDSSAFHAEIVEYIGLITPPGPTSEILRIAVPKSGSVAASSRPGRPSSVIGWSAVSVTSPSQRSSAPPPPLPDPVEVLPVPELVELVPAPPPPVPPGPEPPAPAPSSPPQPVRRERTPRSPTTIVRSAPGADTTGREPASPARRPRAVTSETSLVVVRKPSTIDGTFANVTLDCAGELTGWQPFSPYEYTRIDLVTGDFQNVGNCSNGRHEISSPLPFGMTVWGWGSPNAFSFFTQYVSYAYPAGASVQSINEVVIPPVPN